MDSRFLQKYMEETDNTRQKKMKPDMCMYYILPSDSNGHIDKDFVIPVSNIQVKTAMAMYNIFMWGEKEGYKCRLCTIASSVDWSIMYANIKETVASSLGREMFTILL